MTLSSILPDKAVRQLQRAGRALERVERRLSRRQWHYGAFVWGLWENLPDGAHEEIRLLDFYAECSQWINSVTAFPVVSASGETLRRWVDLHRHYQTFPQVEAWKDMLSVNHFEQAKVIGADPTNILTSAEALALAVEHEWTADEMRTALTTKHETNPDVLQIRSQFAPWLGRTPDVLLGMNGNRKQAEYHLREFERLVNEERK